MSGIDFYYMNISAGCLSVLSVCKELGINPNLKVTDVLKGEQFTPEFLAMNPIHTIPTIVDHDNGDFTVWESRVIMTYLIGLTDPHHKLYPSNNLKQKTVIDRWLYFDVGTLYPIVEDIVDPVFLGEKEVNVAKIPLLIEKLTHLDNALSKSKYLASNDHYTIADLSILSSLTYFEAIVVDYSELKHLTQWYQHLKKELPYWNHIHKKGIQEIRDGVAANCTPKK